MTNDDACAILADAAMRDFTRDNLRDTMRHYIDLTDLIDSLIDDDFSLTDAEYTDPNIAAAFAALTDITPIYALLLPRLAALRA